MMGQGILRLKILDPSITNQVGLVQIPIKALRKAFERMSAAITRNRRKLNGHPFAFGQCLKDARQSNRRTEW